MWGSAQRFLQGGFGYCLLFEGKIACWCTGEYASGNNIGIGIETREEYRGRGFATLTAAAFVEHSSGAGLTTWWDAWTGNEASLAVARKVGFVERGQYTVQVGVLPQA